MRAWLTGAAGALLLGATAADLDPERGITSVPGAAQDAPDPADRTAGPADDGSLTVYDAWLRDVLDRDVDGSAALYIAAALDESAAPGRRAFSFARLADRAWLVGDPSTERHALDQIGALLGTSVAPREGVPVPALEDLRGALQASRDPAHDSAVRAAREALEAALIEEPSRGRRHAATVATIAAERRQADLTRLRGEIDAARRRGDRAAERRARGQIFGLVFARAGDDVRASFDAQRTRVLELLATGQTAAVEQLWQRISPTRRDDYTAFDAADRKGLETAVDALAKRVQRADLSRQETRTTAALVDRLREMLTTGQDAEAARVLRLIPLLDR